jgi:endonuclease/exonuclease/phosphatase family metal-dependent hydrolase
MMNFQDIDLCMAKKINEDDNTTKLPAECLDCLVSQYTESNSYDFSLWKCMTGYRTRRTSFNGNNGLVLLSKFQIFDRKRIDLPGNYVKRGALTGKVKGAIIACTDIAEELKAPYTGKYGAFLNKTGYTEENRMGFELMVNFFRDVIGPAVWLGDMSAGPGLGSLTGINEENYGIAKDAGFISALETVAPVPCTLCYTEENKDGTHNNWQQQNVKAVDHIFVRVADIVPDSVGIVLDEEIDSILAPAKATLSDHKGVRASVNYR